MPPVACFGWLRIAVMMQQLLHLGWQLTEWFTHSVGTACTACCPAESSSRSDNFYEVDVPVKGHRSLQGASQHPTL